MSGTGPVLTTDNRFLTHLLLHTTNVNGDVLTADSRINACDVPDKYEELQKEYDSYVCLVRIACSELCIGSLYIARSDNITEWTLGFKN